MLDGSPAHSDEANIGNVENNNPISLISSSDGVNKARLKKGGRKLRSTAPLHHQKPPRNSPNIRLSDHNNNNTLTASSANKPAALPGTELPAGTQTVLSLHQLKQGAKKEVNSRFIAAGISCSSLDCLCLPPSQQRGQENTEYDIQCLFLSSKITSIITQKSVFNPQNVFKSVLSCKHTIFFTYFTSQLRD